MSAFAGAPTLEGVLIGMALTLILAFLSCWIVRNYP